MLPSTGAAISAAQLAIAVTEISTNTFHYRGYFYIPHNPYYIFLNRRLYPLQGSNLY